MNYKLTMTQRFDEGYLLGSGLGTSDPLVVGVFRRGFLQERLEVLLILRQSLDLEKHQTLEEVVNTAEASNMKSFVRG